MADDPSDLWSQLETLDRAEPLDAEDDLILRMAAVSKVRGKRERKARGGSSSRGPGKTIGKQRPSPKKAAKKTRQPDDRMTG